LSQLPFRSLSAITAIGLGESATLFRFSVAPTHFLYDQAARVGDLLFHDGYFVITGYNKAMYTELWPEIGHVTSEDLGRMESDSSLNRVYSNGELDIWLGLSQ
jgi:hypothetical protein